MLARRSFLRAAARSAALASFGISGLPAFAFRGRAVLPDSSVERAYNFLDAMMDRYFLGQTVRLAQSYVPTAKLNLGDIGFTYDNALMLVAFLQRGSGDDLARANVLGESLAYAQERDPVADGRVRGAYHCDPFVKHNGSVNIADRSSECGDLAWAGIALAHLYAATSVSEYLSAAVGLGSWIRQNAYDTRGAGGYTGGYNGQNKIPWKSTEHNIDIYAFFGMLASLTGNSIWGLGAEHALNFVHAMWNSSGGFFWVGTLNDGTTLNKSFIPEDVQSWSYLALKDASHASSLDWAFANLSVARGQFAGVSFSNSDLSGVWFEGTGHMAAGFLARNYSEDGAKAAAFLADIAYAQAHAPHRDGNGIDAASKDGLRTGDGDAYYAALHTGATAWYALASQSGNPLRL